MKLLLVLVPSGDDPAARRMHVSCGPYGPFANGLSWAPSEGDGRSRAVWTMVYPLDDRFVRWTVLVLPDGACGATLEP